MGLVLRTYRDATLAALRGDRALTQEEVSRTIDVARVALVIAVIFNHYNRFPNSAVHPRVGLDVTNHPLATFVNSFLGHSFLGLIALFAAMSGYLFFSLKSDIWSTIRRRITTRFYTLVIPLVFWSAVYMLFLYGVFLHAPDSPLFLDFDINFRTDHVFYYVNKLVGIVSAPISYQFWFVRDLFVTILFAPLIWFVLQRAPWFGAAVVAFIWIVNPTQHIFFRLDIFCFFFFGGFLRVQRISPQVGLQAAIVLFGVTLIFAAMRSAGPLYLDPSLSFDRFPLSVLTRVMRGVSVIALWGLLIQLARTKIGAAVVPYAAPAFFLFCIHAILIAEIKILLWPLIPAETDFWMLVHYFSTIGLTIAVSAGLGWLLWRAAPGVFSFVTGNRKSYSEIPDSR